MRFRFCVRRAFFNAALGNRVISPLLGKLEVEVFSGWLKGLGDFPACFQVVRPGPAFSLAAIMSRLAL
jgi:hypothetical protein